RGRPEGRTGAAAVPEDRVRGLGERTGAELARLGVAAQGHRQVEIGEGHLEDGFDSLPALEGEAPEIGAAEEDGVGTEGERLDDVAAGADAAVEEDGEVVADRLGDRGQGVE